MPVIDVQNLTKSFDQLQAVDGISFQVNKGECFGLLGPNGAGKTTTIRMLYGFTPPSGGQLRIFGEDLPDRLRRVKYRMGICQQEDNLDPDLSVLDNLLTFSRYFDLPKREALDRAKSLLNFFGLENRAQAKIQPLSGGMKRRLVLARSLINQPELLILDEPTTGLDPQSRHQMWDRLEKLKNDGLTILLTTHYMEEAASLCDRLIIMDHGHILVEGAPAELVRSHVGRDVLDIRDPDPRIRDFLRDHDVAYEDFGHRLLVYSMAGDDLLLRLSRDFSATGLHLRPATLEDVFLRLTGRELRE